MKMHICINIFTLFLSKVNTYSDVFDNFQSISVEQADKYLQDSGIKVG